MPNPTATLNDINEDLFWSHVDKSGDCWLWTAYTSNGYGRTAARRHGVQRVFLAHRASYHLTGHVIPEGMVLDHTCHNRSCVNPAHLRPVTNKQNMEHRSGAQSDSKTGIRGVSWCATDKSWRVDARHKGKTIYGGRFADIADAEAAAIALRNKLFTHNDLDRKAVA
jgi:hypothetical protein